MKTAAPITPHYFLVMFILRDSYWQESDTVHLKGCGVKRDVLPIESQSSALSVRYIMGPYFIAKYNNFCTAMFVNSKSNIFFIKLI